MRLNKQMIVTYYINQSERKVVFTEKYGKNQKEEVVMKIKRYLCLRFLEKNNIHDIFNNLNNSELVFIIERYSSHDNFIIANKTIRPDGSIWIRRYSGWNDSSYNATTHTKDNKGRSKYVIMHQYDENEKIFSILEFDNWYLVLVLYCLQQKHIHIFL